MLNNSKLSYKQEGVNFKANSGPTKLCLINSILYCLFIYKLGTGVQTLWPSWERGKK